MSSVMATISAHRLACDKKVKKPSPALENSKIAPELVNSKTKAIGFIKPETDDANSMRGLTKAITDGRYGFDRMKESIFGGKMN